MKQEGNMIGIIVGTVFVALLFCALKVLNFAWLKPKKLEKRLRAQGIHGNPYRLLYGDTKDMAMKSKAANKPINLSDNIAPRVIPFHYETIKKYGKESFIWLGPKPTVIIQDPELAKEITMNSEGFPKLKAHPAIRYLFGGIMTYAGAKWAKARKILKPAFRMQQLKDMLPAFRFCTREMMRKWDEKISAEGSGEVDVWPHLQVLTCDAISRTAFGSNYEEGGKIFHLQAEQFERVLAVMSSIYIPGTRFLPTERYRRIKEISKEVKDRVKGIVYRRLDALKAGEPSKNDLLGILLDSNRKEIEERGSSKYGLSIHDVVEECRLFYFAGEESTTSLLTWTMFLLASHKEWQSRAREEVLQVFGNEEPDFDGLNRLKIMTMIVNETLRLYPPVYFMNRRTDGETKVGNFTFPDGVQLYVSILLLHRDTEVWGDDANEFKPERFSEGVPHAIGKTGQVPPFIPFGWGPRMCIGQNFAITEAKMGITMILQRFSFELSPSYTHAPSGLGTLHPEHGVHLILHKL